MSRFKGTYSPASAFTSAAVAAPPKASDRPAPTPANAVLPASAAPSVAPLGLAHRLGFFFLCTYLLAWVVNTVIQRAFGIGTYLTAACLAALPLLMLADGSVIASIQRNIGKVWLLFGAWLILGVPMSIWRRGSVELLANYLPRSLALYFFIVSFAVAIPECRRLMNVNIVASALLVVNCWAFGSMKTGRLEIPDSQFFENANDLGLALLLGLCQAAYLFYSRGVWRKILAGLVALGLLYYLFKTGSRGCLAALVLVGVVGLVLGRQKVAFGLAALAGVLIVVLATPEMMRHRLTFYVTDPSSLTTASEEDLAAYGSQEQRARLLRQSIDLTFRHPVFGVGSGQFAVAVNEDAKREHKHAPWLGTHNTYTEVSSECGLLALLFYVAIIFWTFKTALRIYRSTGNRPGQEALAGLSFSLLLGTIAYAGATFFFHVTYTSYLPILSGSVAALWNAVGRGNPNAVATAA